VQGLHLIAARMTGLPELELSQAEALALAESVAAVAREYNLALDGKTSATLQLLAACVMIYAPRFVAVRQRRMATVAGQADAPAS
jgi:hypothetical protein